MNSSPWFCKQLEREAWVMEISQSDSRVMGLDCGYGGIDCLPVLVPGIDRSGTPNLPRIP